MLQYITWSDIWLETILERARQIWENNGWWGADQRANLKIHQMIILPTLRYGKSTHGLAKNTTIKSVDPVHQGGIRLILGNFTICLGKNKEHKNSNKSSTQWFIELEIIIYHETKYTKTNIHKSNGIPLKKCRCHWFIFFNNGIPWTSRSERLSA
jgi:hypothetical protein